MTYEDKMAQIPLILEAPTPETIEKTIQNRKGIIIPGDKTIVYGYGAHNLPVQYYIEMLNSERKAKGKQDLTTQEINKLAMENFTYLVFREDCVAIRPPIDLKNIDVVLDSDELLQQSGFPRYKIRFLHASDRLLNRAMLRRGEWWRLAKAPMTEGEIEKLFLNSITNLSSKAYYWYNMETGTRWLTYDGLKSLEKLNPPELAAALNEILKYSKLKNAQRKPEIDFFMARREKFDIKDLLSSNEINENNAVETYNELSRRFRAAVNKRYLIDDERNPEWKNAMLLTLTNTGKQEFDEMPEDSLMGLSSEYFMKLRWLPGARIRDGILARDPVYELIKKEKKCTCGLDEICSTHEDIVLGIIEDKFREKQRKVLSANVGCVISPLSERENGKDKKQDMIPERRGVYLLVMEEKGRRKLTEKLIRMQKRDISTFLDEGHDIGDAHLLADQYTQYILDRNFACDELGMDVMPITAGSVAETYHGKNEKYSGVKITATYFERDYLHGTATSKIPEERFGNKKFNQAFFYKLGVKAAINLASGRTDKIGKVLFDDGDEVLIGERIITSDMTGAFKDYKSNLEKFIPSYALPLLKRKNFIADINEAVDCYTGGFLDGFITLQQHYYYNLEPMENLPFKSRGNIEEFNMQVRWIPVLRRIGTADPNLLATNLREEILRNIK
jgi:hypothetical protein